MTLASSYAIENQKIGRAAEDDCSRRLHEAGYIVLRTKASRGPYDICAIGPGGVLLVQVKATASKDLRGRAKALHDLGRIRQPIVLNGAKSRRKQAWVWVGGKQKWHITEIMQDGSQNQMWVS